MAEKKLSRKEGPGTGGTGTREDTLKEETFCLFLASGRRKKDGGGGFFGKKPKTSKGDKKGGEKCHGNESQQKAGDDETWNGLIPANSARRKGKGTAIRQ